ncbi:MAG: hypothetical protein KDC24_04465 [Saprospiraceae bacterium]|nr:hypothetical protein [Saprospiraceae bacterium]
MKQLLLPSILTLLLFSSCGIFKKVEKSDNALPAAFADIKFGMTESMASSIRTAMEKQDQQFDFRQVYMEESPGENINYAVYYFDADDNKPLYEVIIEYPDIQSRDAAAAALLGPPNQGGEWYFEKKWEYPIKAWVFKNKLVIAALIPNTEWYEEAQKGVDDWK